MGLLKTTDNQIVTVDQSESLLLRVTLTDYDGAALDASLTADIKLSLYDRDTKQIINSRNDVSVKNANNGTVTTGGLLDLRLGTADAAIVDTDLAENEVEQHVARVSFTWNDGYGTQTGKGETQFGVRKLATLTT